MVCVPDLTPEGQSEATKLGLWLRSAGISERRKLTIMPSPFKRTLDTALGLKQALPQARVLVRPDVFEVGGVYCARGGVRAGPGKCLSAAEIRAQFPSYDTSLLPQSGAWYTGGWESDGEGRARAARVAAWLRSDEFLASIGDGMAVLVMHYHFIDALTKALLGIADEPSRDKPSSNSGHEQPIHVMTPNTATSLFILSKGQVSVRWLGSTEHLGRTAVELLAKL